MAEPPSIFCKYSKRREQYQMKTQVFLQTQKIKPHWHILSMCLVLIYSVLKVHADKRRYFHINKTDKTTGFHSKRDPNVERNLLTGSLLTLNQSSDIFYAYILLFHAVLKAGTEPKVKLQDSDRYFHSCFSLPIYLA